MWNNVLIPLKSHDHKSPIVDNAEPGWLTTRFLICIVMCTKFNWGDFLVMLVLLPAHLLQRIGCPCSHYFMKGFPRGFTWDWKLSHPLKHSFQLYYYLKFIYIFNRFPKQSMMKTQNLGADSHCMKIHLLNMSWICDFTRTLVCIRRSAVRR